MTTSTRVARAAGNNVATNATTAMSKTEPAKINGVATVVVGADALKTRINVTAPITPAAEPASARNTHRTTR